MIASEYKMTCKTPCYVDAENASRENPYRLNIAVTEDGMIWLAASGNGCGDDILLDETSEVWQTMDANALRDNAAELRSAGFEDAADCVEGKADEIAQTPKTYYAITNGSSGDWDGDGSYDLDEAEEMLVAAWNEWNADEDEYEENEPEIAIISEHSDGEKNCVGIIRYNAETGCFEEA